jgi:hypothetical protein
MLRFGCCCKRFAWPAVLVALAAFLTQSTLVAQTTGTFFGTVNDPAGAVVPHAKVTLVNERSADLRHVTTNQAGYFTFAGVLPGTFILKVEADGFKTWQRNGLVMNAGDTRDVTGIKLAVGGSHEVVTVESTMSGVEVVDSGEHAAVLSTKEIDNLGLIGRNVTELLKVLPGVNSVANGVNSGTSGYDPMENGISGSYIGNGYSTNGAPYRGGTALMLDGANIIDPGCACFSSASPNPEFTQEVKVQTSNFSAEVPNGPVIVNVLSKYGTQKYHGTGYFFTRNEVLNANSHEHELNQVKRDEESYYYPGGNLGGPIPGTKGKLLFWSGFEYFWQKLPSSTALTSWIPTQDMLNGNFGPTAANVAMCPNGMGTNDGTLCAAVTGFAPNGTALNGATDISQYLNQNALNLVKAYLVKPNATPTAANDYANFYLPYSLQHNGYLFRQRLDFNKSVNTKIYASYQYGNDGTFDIAHQWFIPGASVPYPGGISQQNRTHTFSSHFLHVFSSTLTNEVSGTWQQLTGPRTANPITRNSANFTIGSYYGNNSILPSLSGPSSKGGLVMDQPDLFSTGGFPTQKISYSVGDVVTKVYRTHTFKGGFRFEKNGNLQADYIFPNGEVSYDSTIRNGLAGYKIGTGNPVANLLMGISSGYQETNKLPTYDLDNKNYSFFGQDDWKITRRLTLNIGARFERLGRWYDNTNQGLAVWLPGRFQSDLASGKAYPGLYWHAIDPGIPLGGSPNPNVQVSPRLGLAWDVFDNGKTVVRGGWGMYRWQDQFNDYAGALKPGLNATTYKSNSSLNVTMADLASIAGQGANATTAWNASSAGDISVTDPLDKKTDVTKDWNFTITQELPWRSAMEVAYVGNETTNLLVGGQSDGGRGVASDYINQNKMAKGALFGPDPVTGVVAPDPETANTADYKPFRNGYGNAKISMPQHVGWANYHALQVAWLKRSNHANINLNYTWSKALGIINSTVDAYDLHNDYGVLGIDRPHVFNASYSYEFGNQYKGDTKLLSGAINGWTVSGTTTIQSGANLQSQANAYNLSMLLEGGNITTKTYFGTDVGQILPITTCDLQANRPKYALVNMSCLSAPPIGQQGRMQLGYLSGPMYWNSDVSLYKSFRVKESQNVQFRFSAFNFMNHALRGYSNTDQIQPKFSRVNGAWVDDGSGSGVLNTLTGRRVIELGLKYNF